MNRAQKIMLYPVIKFHAEMIKQIVTLAVKKPGKFLKYFYSYLAFGLLGWFLFLIR